MHCCKYCVSSHGAKVQFAWCGLQSTTGAEQPPAYHSFAKKAALKKKSSSSFRDTGCNTGFLQSASLPGPSKPRWCLDTPRLCIETSMWTARRRAVLGTPVDSGPRAGRCPPEDGAVFKAGSGVHKNVHTWFNGILLQET